MQLYFDFEKIPTTENRANYQRTKRFTITVKHEDKTNSNCFARYIKKYLGDSKMQWKAVNTTLNREKKYQD
jgi:hypothetical protein